MEEDIKEPPVGLFPRFIHDASRLTDVRLAIIRYYEAGLEIPIEWIEEYNELTKRNDGNRKHK